MRILIALLMLLPNMAKPQQENVLSFEEYLNIVRENHPLVRITKINLEKAEANVTEARGAFDPVIAAEADAKRFKDIPYYQHRAAIFKIPTWYGIELNAGIENNDGWYVNPENRVPESGLSSVGIKVPLGQGLWINRRMADLRKAKIAIELTRAEQQLKAAEIIEQAALAYFSWKRSYDEALLYKKYLEVARTRKLAVITSIELGDKPAIDSTEAAIIEKTRQLGYEDAQLKLAKSILDLSNFLWDGNIPVELRDNAVPQQNVSRVVGTALNIDTTTSEIENHPKIVALQNEISILDIERRINGNQLLPKFDVGYSYLSDDWQIAGNAQQNYKVMANFEFPLFLRKERGALKMSKLKLQESRIALDYEKLKLRNKIDAARTEIGSLERQFELAADVVRDHEKLVNSEERMLTLGESSLFLINSRESALISAKLNEIGNEYRLLAAQSNLFRILSNVL